jgi:hypothetical protein
VTLRQLVGEASHADPQAAAALLQGLQALSPHPFSTTCSNSSGSFSSHAGAGQQLLEASRALACCSTLLTGLLQGSSLCGAEVAPGAAAVVSSCWLVVLRWGKALLSSQGPLSSITSSSSSRGRSSASSELDKGLQEHVLCQAASALLLATAAGAAVAARAPAWVQPLQVLWQAGQSTVQVSQAGKFGCCGVPCAASVYVDAAASGRAGFGLRKAGGPQPA